MIVALYLPKEVIAQSITLIWPHLDRFCRRFHEDYNLRDVQLALLGGQKVGFMAWDEDKKISYAFAFGEVVTDYDNQRTLRMEMIEGDGLGDWRDIMDEEFTRFAKANNCKQVRFIGRKGWVKRLPSWRVRYYVFERRIERTA